MSQLPPDWPLRDATARLLDYLQQHNIYSILVAFSGSGDSGSISDISFEIGEGSEPSSLSRDLGGEIFVDRAGHITLGEHFLWLVGENNKYPTVRNLVEAICYELLGMDHGGWECDAGSEGDFEFNVETRDIILNFLKRTTETVRYEL